MQQSLVIAIILLSLIGIYINISSPTFFKNEKLFEKALKPSLEPQKTSLQNIAHSPKYDGEGNSSENTIPNAQMDKRAADFHRRTTEENRYGIKSSPEYYLNSKSFTINDNSNVTSRQAIQVVQQLPPPAVAPNYEGLPANYNPSATNNAIINRGASVGEFSTQLTSAQYPVSDRIINHARTPYSTEFEVNYKPDLNLTSHNREYLIMKKRPKKTN
jgi:hypothetical protein